MTPLICPQCGHDNLPDGVFCGRCGAELLPPEPEAAAELVSRDLDSANSGFADSAASGTGPPAGRWQHVILMGLAATILLVGAVPIFLATTEINPRYAIFLWVLAAMLILGGVGFGFAAVRPPGGILRRVIVGFAVLAVGFGFPILVLVVLVVLVGLVFLISLLL